VTVTQWPDVEECLCDLLADLGTTGEETPADLQSSLPFIRVTRTGGADDRLVTDSATVSIDVFAADRGTARALAETIRQRLLNDLPAATAHGVIDYAATSVAAIQSPPTDTDNLRLAVASYRVSARLQEGSS
jgi:hypothetical protein